MSDMHGIAVETTAQPGADPRPYRIHFQQILAIHRALGLGQRQKTEHAKATDVVEHPAQILAIWEQIRPYRSDELPEGKWRFKWNPYDWPV